MTVHHEVLRAQLNKYKGVEMQNDGDAVLLGFRDPVSAIAWCLSTQQVCVACTSLSLAGMLYATNDTHLHTFLECFCVGWMMLLISACLTL